MLCIIETARLQNLLRWLRSVYLFGMEHRGSGAVLETHFKQAACVHLLAGDYLSTQIYTVYSLCAPNIPGKCINIIKDGHLTLEVWMLWSSSTGNTAAFWTCFYIDSLTKGSEAVSQTLKGHKLFWWFRKLPKIFACIMTSFSTDWVSNLQPPGEDIKCGFYPDRDPEFMARLLDTFELPLPCSSRVLGPDTAERGMLWLGAAASAQAQEQNEYVT